MGLEPRGAASAKAREPDPACPGAAECPLGLGQPSGWFLMGRGLWSGIGVAPRCSRRWGTADGKPDAGDPHVRFDEGSLR